MEDGVEALPVSVEKELRMGAPSPAVSVTQASDLLWIAQPVIVALFCSANT